MIINSDWNTCTGSDRYVNLSSNILNKYDKVALGYSLNLAISNSAKSINPLRVSKSFEKSERLTADASIVNVCKGFRYRSMSRPSIDSCSARLSRSLIQLKKNRDIHITKAAKSNALAL